MKGYQGNDSTSIQVASKRFVFADDSVLWWNSFIILLSFLYIRKSYSPSNSSIVYILYGVSTETIIVVFAVSETVKPRCIVICCISSGVVKWWDITSLVQSVSRGILLCPFHQGLSLLSQPIRKPFELRKNKVCRMIYWRIPCLARLQW